MKVNKILCAGTALILAGALGGCSVKVGTNKSPDLIVAEPSSGDFGEDMKITFGDFNREYEYTLKGEEIEDDTDESYADACKSQRETIINYLINERIILKKAREMGVISLTEEEMKAAEEEYNSQIEEQIEYFGGKADYGTRDAATITDEEKRERGIKEFDDYLADCGMTRDDLLTWSVNSAITNKLMAEVGKSVDYSAAEESYREYEDKIKQLYTDNVAEYEQGGFTQVWVPEGSRLIKHILLGFDDDTMIGIETKRSNGDDAGADSLRAEKAAELQPQVDEVQQKLDSGEDIKTLILEYSMDAASSSMYPDGYVVVPDGVIFMEEFQKAAFEMKKVGDRTVCVTDYGVHIMIYAGDAKVDPNNVKAFTDYLYEQMVQTEFSKKMEEWRAEYDYRIDYEALRLDDPDESSGSES